MDFYGQPSRGLLISWLKVRVLRGSPRTSEATKNESRAIGAARLFSARARCRIGAEVCRALTVAWPRDQAKIWDAADAAPKRARTGPEAGRAPRRDRRQYAQPARIGRTRSQPGGPGPHLRRARARPPRAARCSGRRGIPNEDAAQLLADDDVARIARLFTRPGSSLTTH